MNVRMFILGLALAAVLMVPAVSAQESFLYSDTFGLFGNDIDFYLDPNDYADVEIDRAFGFIQGGSFRGSNPVPLDGKNISTNGIAAGYATHIKNTYLGLYFNGNLWGGNTVTAYDEDGKEISADEGGVTFTGLFQAMLGLKFGGIGLLLDFDHVYLNYDHSTRSEETTAASSSGFTTIGVFWGNNFQFKGNKFSPQVLLAYRISNIYSYYKYKGDEYYSYVPIDDFFYPMSHLIINPAAEYTLPSGTLLYAEYVLDFGILPYEFAAADGDKITWEGYHVTNILDAGINKTIDITSRFALGFGAGLTLSLNSRRTRYTDDGVFGDGTINGNDVVYFGIGPYAEAGAVYTFVRRPFNVHVGLELAAFDRDESGEIQAADMWAVESTRYYNGYGTGQTDVGVFKQLGVDLGLGLGFTPIKNFALDLSLSKYVGQYIKDDLSYDGHDHNFWDNDLTFAIQAAIRY